ncbi:MAG: S8 family serine peptidase [Planctomycetota bacterium]|nr:S8 family serine peptidase [Planctomycetota bacterium]
MHLASPQPLDARNKLMLYRLLLVGFLASTFSAAAQAQDDNSALIHLVFERFDPLIAKPTIPTALHSKADNQLWIVQFAGKPTESGRSIIRQLGGQLHSYLPDDAHVVRMTSDHANSVDQLGFVRWVGPYHPAYRLEPAIREELVGDADLPTRRYNIVVVDKRQDKPGLMAKIAGIGGQIDNEQDGSILLEATLTGAQLQQVAQFDEVLWIDRWTATDYDMDNARIQGGGNHVETQGNYTGTGVGAHIYEGIEASHPDFTGTVTNVLSSGASAAHGHATAGIVFGNGTSNSNVRGMAPDANKFYTDNSSVSTSRWQVVNDLVNNLEVSHTTASWGNARTRSYTSISADADDIIFDHNIAWTQSQSNAGNQDSRPQAWAKNIFSIGGVNHGNNSNAGDDSWAAGGGSTGPAEDGRIKPTLCAYYDSIGTSDLSGGAGYSGGNWTSGFGGTSGATPIVAGHNILAIEMFTDGIFGNTLRNPGGSRHSNRPHFTTLKALQVVSAAQYSFNATSSDNRREHQGWGFPDLQGMYDDRNKIFIVDETDVLTQNAASRWLITVGNGEPELKICMTYADPAGNPGATKHRINDLSIRVTAPDGTVYWGNNGLEDGNYSVAGGAEDDTNTIECVFVQNPAAGQWKVDVKATLVAQDSHVETPTVDADYGLVVRGGTGVAGPAPSFPGFLIFGQGCPGTIQEQFCAELNPGGGTLSGNTQNNEYAYQVLATGTTQVTGFEVYTQSVAGFAVNAGAHLYQSSGAGPAASPIASTTMAIGTVPGFYTATFATPQTVTGNYFISLDHTGNNTYVSELTNGNSGSAYYRGTPLSGGWTSSNLITTPSYKVTCANAPFSIPELSNQGEPVINGTYDLLLTNARPFSVALTVMGFSDTTWSGGGLPAQFPGAPGCDLLISPEATLMFFTSIQGNSTFVVPLPNNQGIVGIDLFHQWLILDSANPLGVISSNAGRATIGS